MYNKAEMNKADLDRLGHAIGSWLSCSIRDWAEDKNKKIQEKRNIEKVPRKGT